MSKTSDPIKKVRRIVVAFDICSSTAILEDLLRTENEGRWRNLLIGMKQELVRLSREFRFEIYKFTGDGWLLLFDEGSISSTQLFRTLLTISITYQYLFHTKICEVLESNPPAIGLTFGVDSGTLVALVMNEKTEYVGRALNVAVRLQGVISEIDRQPSEKVLISKNAFTQMRCGRTKRTSGVLVTCKLRNLAGNKKIQVRKLYLLEESEESVRKATLENQVDAFWKDFKDRIHGSPSPS
jgi:class 3 adenylate cyclase